MEVSSISRGDRPLLLHIDEAEAVGDLAAGEEVAPERLLLRQGFVLIDRLDGEVMGLAHGIGAPVDLPVAHEDAPRCGPQHAGHHLDEGRFPGAIVADQPDDLVAPDLEIDVAQPLDGAEELLHLLQADDVLIVGCGGWRSGRRRHLPPVTMAA